MLNNFFRGFLGVVRIEPSSRCNLKCIHCPTGTIKASRGLMDSSTFYLVLQNIRDNLKEIRVVVLYHGGEPFLNKNFPMMVKQIKEPGVPYVKTVTNGMLLNDQLIAEICESGLDAIEFSLDGISFEQNDIIRKGCKGKSVIEKIKRLIDYKKRKNLQKPEIFISTTQFVKVQAKKLNLSLFVPDYLLDVFSDEIKQQDLAFKTAFAMKWPDMKVDEKKFP